MMKKTVGLVVLLGVASTLSAQQSVSGSARENFMKQQAYAEVQRVSGQVDMLEANQSALAERVGRLERGGGEVASLKAEIDALRSEINRLRNEQQAQRKEIVADLLKRIKAQETARPVALPPSPPAAQGTYVVQSGDTLSLIAQAFGTSVSKLKSMNNLHGDGLRPGQKLVVPEANGKTR